MKQPITIKLTHIIIILLILVTYFGLTKHGANLHESKRQSRLHERINASSIAYNMKQSANKVKRSELFNALKSPSSISKLVKKTWGEM